MEVSVIETAAKLCTSAVEKLGYDLVEVTYKKEVDGMNLTFYIESQNGEAITLDDCEKVSSTVETILDTETLDGQPYLLSVSSLGLDRPIKTDKDFHRNEGKMVEVKLYSKQEGQKDFTGILTAWNSETLTVLVKEKKKSDVERVFNRKDIAHVAPHISF